MNLRTIKNIEEKVETATDQPQIFGREPFDLDIVKWEW